MLFNCCLPRSSFDYTPLLPQKMESVAIHPDFVDLHRSLEASFGNDRQKLEVLCSLDWSTPAALAATIAHRILWSEKENTLYRNDFIQKCKVPLNGAAKAFVQSRNKVGLRVTRERVLEVLHFNTLTEVENDKLITLFTLPKPPKLQFNEIVELAKAINRVHKKFLTLETVQEASRSNPSYELVIAIKEGNS